MNSLKNKAKSKEKSCLSSKALSEKNLITNNHSILNFVKVNKVNVEAD
jgi:hypothetical protein